MLIYASADRQRSLVCTLGAHPARRPLLQLVMTGRSAAKFQARETAHTYASGADLQSGQGALDTTSSGAAKGAVTMPSLCASRAFRALVRALYSRFSSASGTP